MIHNLHQVDALTMAPDTPRRFMVTLRAPGLPDEEVLLFIWMQVEEQAWEWLDKGYQVEVTDLETGEVRLLDESMFPEPIQRQRLVARADRALGIWHMHRAGVSLEMIARRASVLPSLVERTLAELAALGF